MSILLGPQPQLEAVEEALVPVVKRRPRRIWAWLLGLWIISGAYIVPADQQAVVTRFGAVVNPRVPPGIHYALPWPVDSVYKLKVHQLQRTLIGGEIPDAILGRSEPSS